MNSIYDIIEIDIKQIFQSSSENILRKEIDEGEFTFCVSVIMMTIDYLKSKRNNAVIMKGNLSNNKRLNEWISVLEKLPDCQKVLAIHIPESGVIYNIKEEEWFINTIYTCSMKEGKFIIESYGPYFPATHWMPLPSFPEKQHN